MMFPTKANGLTEAGMALVFKFGLMAPNTKANGKTIRPMDKENFAILMETSMKVNG
jgi:hypothetical protein